MAIGAGSWTVDVNAISWSSYTVTGATGVAGHAPKLLGCRTMVASQLLQLYQGAATFMWPFTLTKVTAILSPAAEGSGCRHSAAAHCGTGGMQLPAAAASRQPALLQLRDVVCTLPLCTTGAEDQLVTHQVPNITKPLIGAADDLLTAQHWALRR
jgi:hypothetical protein